MGYIRYIPIGLVALSLYLGGSDAIQAQESTCKNRSVVIGSLEREYGEAVIFQGMADEMVLEIVANPETGTWSILVTFPDDQGTCLKASGMEFKTREYKKPTVGS